MGAVSCPVVIAAYRPRPKFAALVQAIRAITPDPILIVNDGSGPDADRVFAAVADVDNVHVLTHAVNLGKGQAIKTAVNHVLNTWGRSVRGIVTADADGQHLPADIARIAEALKADPASLHLGARRFSAAVPLRSRVGNALARLVFRILLGRRLSDTQTGPRDVPASLLPRLLHIRYNRYECLPALLRQLAGDLPDRPRRVQRGVPVDPSPARELPRRPDSRRGLQLRSLACDRVFAPEASLPARRPRTRRWLLVSWWSPTRSCAPSCSPFR